MPPETPLAPPSLHDEFVRFLKARYPDPPSLLDPHPAVRGQYLQLRDAFVAGWAAAWAAADAAGKGDAA